jgi:GT2 family glycosyltransferase/glycosyltransferase involved in cell wall biosynthesis
LFEAIQKAEFPTEVIVVDGGSNDCTVEWLRDAFPTVETLALEANLGFSGNANAGVDLARYEFVYLLNNDMEVESGFLNTLVGAMDAPDVFAATSRIEVKADQAETGWTEGAIRKGLLEIRHRRTDFELVRYALYAGGGSSLFRREIFLELGGFDSLYSPYYAEDLDISWRAWQAGFKVVWVPQSKVVHQRRATIERISSRSVADRVLGKNLLIASWRNTFSPELLLETTLGALQAVIDRRLSVRTLFEASRSVGNIANRRRLSPIPVRTDKAILGMSRLPVASTKKDRSNLRILALSPYCPIPPVHGGAVRMLEILKRVAMSHEVHFICFGESKQDLELEAELGKIFASAKIVMKEPSNLATGLLDPNSAAEYRQQSFADAVDDAVAEASFDLVQVEYPNLAHYLPFEGSEKTVITQIDLLHKTMFQKAQQGSFSALLESLRLFKYEVENAERSDLVLTMSEKEASELTRVAKTNVAVCSNGVDTEKINWSPPADTARLLFVGNFRHPPNTEAILWFAENIYPRIRESNRAARLTIVGPNPPPQVQDLASDPSIKVTGKVDDLYPLYRSHRCAIAPIRRGSGTRIKILEAMAAGTPVVSTSIGAEGLALEPGKHILLGDDSETFSQAVVEVLTNSDLASGLSTAARDLVEAKYGWDRIAENLCRQYEKLVGEGR